MFVVFAQGNAPSPLVTAILFTAVSLPVGLLIGYLRAYRFKRQYMQAARELANLRGENFRGELTTIRRPVAQPDRERDALRAERAESQRLLDAAQRRIGELEDELARQQSATPVPIASPPIPASGTEAWQLAQLHKEQILTQLRLDEQAERIRSLTAQLDQARVELQHVHSQSAEYQSQLAVAQQERDLLRARLAAVDAV